VVDRSESVPRRRSPGGIDAAGDLAEIGDVVDRAGGARSANIALRRIAGTSPSTVVTDVRTKRTTVEAATALAESVTFIGGHPQRRARGGSSSPPACSPAVPGFSLHTTIAVIAS
jgi:prephenate dehydrogenase